MNRTFAAETYNSSESTKSIAFLRDHINVGEELHKTPEQRN
jgi:hypothetical protein